ncbi:MAG: hypothetical protein Q9173_000855 [Seirophora scorigena]
MADSTPKSYHTDPTLYLYTSLTAGSSHITTATSRLETILKANRIPYQALDVATDEKARMLWGRRAGKKKLPGLVRMGMLVGDLEEIEDWNEYGELKEKVGVPARSSTPSTANTPTKVPQSYSTPSKLSTTNTLSTYSPSLGSPSEPSAPSQPESPMTAAMRQAGMEAAKKAGDAKARVSKAGMSSTIPPQTPNKPVSSKSGDTSTATDVEDVASSKGQGTADTEADAAAIPKDTSQVPRDDIYEGRGSNDPDKEAVVADSKDTIDVKDNATSGVEDTNSGDPGHKVVIPGSQDGNGPKASAPSHLGIARPDDPDAEAVVPGSKDRVEEDEESMSHSELETHDDDDEDSDSIDAVKVGGRTTVESTTKATAASDDTQDLPGKRTQNQAPAKGDEAGASIGD